MVIPVLVKLEKHDRSIAWLRLSSAIDKLTFEEVVICWSAENVVKSSVLGLLSFHNRKINFAARRVELTQREFRVNSPQNVRSREAADRECLPFYLLVV